MVDRQAVDENKTSGLASAAHTLFHELGCAEIGTSQPIATETGAGLPADSMPCYRLLGWTAAKASFQGPEPILKLLQQAVTLPKALLKEGQRGFLRLVVRNYLAALHAKAGLSADEALSYRVMSETQ